METKRVRQMDREGREHAEKWAVEIFDTAELGDLWRTDRLVKIATTIAENPSASLPASVAISRRLSDGPPQWQTECSGWLSIQTVETSRSSRGSLSSSRNCQR